MTGRHVWLAETHVTDTDLLHVCHSMLKHQACEQASSAANSLLLEAERSFIDIDVTAPDSDITFWMRTVADRNVPTPCVSNSTMPRSREIAA